MRDGRVNRRDAEGAEEVKSSAPSTQINSGEKSEKDRVFYLVDFGLSAFVWGDFEFAVASATARARIAS
jgi:hypothetical protein